MKAESKTSDCTVGNTMIVIITTAWQKTFFNDSYIDNWDILKYPNYCIYNDINKTFTYDTNLIS